MTKLSDGLPSYQSPAVERAFAVLTRLADRPEGATLSELSRSTGTPASTLLGILGSLRNCRAVQRNSTKRYVLDVGVLQIGQAYVEGVDLMRLFFPVGQRLRAAFNETVQLGVLAGDEAMYVARQESTQPIRLVGLVGRRIPAHASAVGKVLLGQMEEKEVGALLGEEPFLQRTPNTLTTYDALLPELAATRQRGFGESCEECILGLHCLSAPVFDHRGIATAALCVSVPTARMSSEQRDRIVSGVMRAAGELSAAMGAHGTGRRHVGETSGVGRQARRGSRRNLIGTR